VKITYLQEDVAVVIMSAQGGSVFTFVSYFVCFVSVCEKNLKKNNSFGPIFTKLDGLMI